MVSKRLPKISVITPSYNTGKYIEATIKSIINQQYNNIEHIIFDGNSQDNTVDILKQYSHLKWISEPDSGQSSALNKGFKLAKGKYIVWLNSDDILTEGSLYRSIKILEDNPEIDMIYTDINIINESGDIYGKAKGKKFNIINLLNDNPVKQPSSVFRKTVLDKLKGVDESLHYSMDRELWLRMFLTDFKIKYIPNLTNASFRLCEGTKTFNETPKFRLEWIKVLKNINQQQFISSNVLKRSIALNKSAYHLAIMDKSFRENNRLKGTIEFLKTIYMNPKILVNLGIYYKFILGLVGFKLDVTKRFKQ
jgi:glycosyltransferase involved in cell wall biosynthesis